MRTTTTVVIGAGHAGLAMSRCLTERGIDHVVLERGEVANSWRTERWDSLRLLTPNWQSRLPGFSYQGDDPDGFRTMPEVIEFIERYARAISAPVQTSTKVSAVRRTDAGYLVRTDRGDWHGRTLVLATGACNIPSVPKVAEAVPPAVRTLTPMYYRNPDQLEEGGVLVVGASATGIQLADEIHRSGRPVTLAVGEHIRAPRTYRGSDIQWWMDVAGVHRPALRRGRRHRPRAQGAVAPARRLARAQNSGPQRADRHRREARRPARRDQRRQAAVLRLAAQPVRALRPQDGPAARHHRPLGDRQGLDVGSRHRIASPRPRSKSHRRSPWTSSAAESGRSSGRPATAPTTRGSKCRCSTARARFVHDGGVVASPGMYLMGMPVPPPPQVRPDRWRRRRRPRSQRPSCVLPARPNHSGGRLSRSRAKEARPASPQPASEGESRPELVSRLPTPRAKRAS